MFCQTIEKIPEGVTCEFDANDIRFVNDDVARAFKKVSLGKKRLHFSWDDERSEPYIEKGIETMRKAGISPGRLIFYVLIGFNTSKEYDLFRVRRLHELGAESFVMPYDKSDPYQKRFARWCNHKAIFKTVPWEEYQHFKDESNGTLRITEVQQ